MSRGIDVESVDRDRDLQSLLGLESPRRGGCEIDEGWLGDTLLFDVALPDEPLAADGAMELEGAGVERETEVLAAIEHSATAARLWPSMFCKSAFGRLGVVGDDGLCSGGPTRIGDDPAPRATVTSDAAPSPRDAGPSGERPRGTPNGDIVRTGVSA